MKPEPSDQTALHAMDNPRVLIVDDNAANLAAFEAILAAPDVTLVSVPSGAAAMRHLLSEEFAAILLDINMPELDGMQTAALIRQRERSRDIPILFITAYHADQMQMLQGYASGAVDYLVKPVSPQILQSKVRIFVDLYRRKKQVEWQAAQLSEINARLRLEIDERKEAEKDALFEREERQRVTLACIADGVITTNHQGRVTFVNATAEQLTGWSLRAANRLRVSSILNVVAQSQEPAVDQVVESCLRQGQTVRGSEHATLLTKDGRRCHVDYSVAPVHDRQGSVIGTVVIVHDVTERYRAEVKREQLFELEQAARQRAEEASRAKDEFLAVLSHELRTPVNAIVGWTELLRKAGGDQTLSARALDAIHRSAMAQTKLIEDLLDMSRIISGKIQLSMQPVDLAPIIKTAIDIARPVAEKKQIHIEALLDTPADGVNVDRQRLEQVMWNLLSNAVKFTPESGQIQVRLDRFNEAARITVTDTGQGISAEFLPYVFERFRQADSTSTRRHGGLGLGLAIARQIVVMHGGRITVESPGVGLGSSFTVTLPVSGALSLAPQAASPKTDTAIGAAPSAGAETLTGVGVLVVDDDPNTLELLVTAIRAHGAEVRAARSARAALQMLKERSPNVLLSDLSMPEEDGFTLIRKVRALAPEAGGNVPAAALSALATPDDYARALAAGFQMHVAKPVSLAVLIDVIVKLAKRGMQG